MVNIKKLNFLPTKIQYDSRSNNIKMWYRKANNKKLILTDVPFAHSIFIEKKYSQYGEFTENDIYKYLKDDKIEMIELFTSPSEAREIYKMEKYVTGEADCSPEQKFVTSTFYDTEFPSDIKPRVFYLDIETFSTDGKLPTFIHNIAVISAITVYDSYDACYYSWFLLPTNNTYTVSEIDNFNEQILVQTADYGTCKAKLFDNETALMNSFIQFLIAECPDIITAWNSKFDIPYVVRKIVDLFGIETLKKITPFSRISYKVINALEKDLPLEIDSIIPGIDVIDMLELYKKNTPGQKPSYSLNSISEEELDGETKLTTDLGETDPNAMYLGDFVGFCKYNIQDVRLMTLIEKKRKIIDLAIIVRNITKTNYQDIFFETALIDNLFLMEAAKRRADGWKYVLPSKPINAIKEPYLGAYVKAPLTGRFKWVADLDFKSLYPSIVKTFKLSSETLVGVVENKQLITMYNLAKYFDNTNFRNIQEEVLPKYLSYDDDLIAAIASNTPEKVNIKTLGNDTEIIINYYYPMYEGNNYPMTFTNIKEFSEWLKENNYVFMPNGIIVDQNKENAIIPKVIADVMDSRDEYKSLMFSHLTKGNTAKYEVYDSYQTAFKVINNSIYGVTAKESFRLADVKIADAITTTGQLLIRSCTEIVNKYLNILAKTENTDFVLTNDTDSIIFTLSSIVDYPSTERDPEILKEISSYSKLCQDHINDAVYALCKNLFFKYKITKTNNFLTIKNEWLANSGLFIAKKMYVVNKVFKEGIPYEKLASTGISLKRSSTPAALKPFIEKVIVNILSFKDKNDIDDLIIEECKKLKDVYRIQDIAIPSSLHDLASYKNVPIHVRGINIWNEHFAPTEREQLVFGKLKYFYVKSWKNNKLNLDKCYVLSVPNVESYWELIEGKVTLDYSKMKERLIVKPINAFYKAMKWEMPPIENLNNNGIFNQVKRKTKIKLI